MGRADVFPGNERSSLGHPAPPGGDGVHSSAAQYGHQAHGAVGRGAGLAGALAGADSA